MSLRDEHREALLCLSDGSPKWGKDIAEHLGMMSWAQIATGTYYGNQLVSKGLASKKMQRGEPYGKHRAYFYITDAGRAAVQPDTGSVM